MSETLIFAIFPSRFKTNLLYYLLGIMPENWETTIDIDGISVDVLRVPYFPQSSGDNLCYVCSLKMILDYFKNIYPNAVINQNTPNFGLDDIKKITKTHRTGTRTENLVKFLEDNIKTLKFELVRNGDFDAIQENLNNKTPVIVLYCGDYLKYREIAGGHAGVVVGITDDKIILNNPFFGYNFVVDKTEFQDAWEIEYKQFIKIEPIAQTKLPMKIGKIKNMDVDMNAQ